MGMTLIDPPIGTPISLDDAKKQCRVFSAETAYDDEIQAYLEAAVAHLDGYYGILQYALEPQTWKLTLDSFSTAMKLPLKPLISVDEVAYIASTGLPVVVDPSTYTVDDSSEDGWVVLNSGLSWPTPLAGINMVSITATYGFVPITDSNTYLSTVPASIKQVIRLLVGHFFSNHEAVGPANQTPLAMGVQTLLRPFTPLVLQ